MLGRLWPRFALEACFLVGVVVVAGLLHLTTAAIVAVMVVAYLATVAVEWTAARARTTAELEPEPASEPEQPQPVPTSEPQPAEPQPAVAEAAHEPGLPLPAYPQEWNVWEIERLARERSGADPVRVEEWGYPRVYLLEFASPDGLRSADFDALERESFGELVAGRAR